jgi:NDP-sugar pyrophosphorylase family protein
LAGIYILKPEIFKIIPENKYFGMDDLLHIMLNKKIPITKYEIKEYWLDIGQVDDFEKAQEIYKNHFFDKG